MKTSRQNFLKSSVIVGAAAGFPSIIPSSVLGENAPSKQVNIAALACGVRSGSNMEYVRYPKSRIVAVCDPVLERRVAKAKEWGVTDHYNDFRDVLARDDVDAVSISTGDQWHVPMSLAAAKAGKDVYCEKPLGLSIEQCLAARRIEQEYGRVFQYGTQQRSMQHLRMGIEIVLNGHIGDVKEIYVRAPGGSAGGSPTPILPIPEGFDYDLWLGPAPEAPFCHDRIKPSHGLWFIYDYTIGFLGGWGAHPIDQLQWWADAEGLGIPIEYKTTGTYRPQDLYNTVTNWNMEAVYANGTKLYFMDTHTAKNSPQILERDKLDKFDDCTQFVGTKGWVAISRSGLVCSSEELRRKAKNPGPRRLPVSSNGHMGNFVDAVLSRETPVSNLESAIKSDTICHMADIGARTGETLKWDPVKETIIGSETAKNMMHREMRSPYDNLMV